MSPSKRQRQARESHLTLQFERQMEHLHNPMSGGSNNDNSNQGKFANGAKEESKNDVGRTWHF